MNWKRMWIVARTDLKQLAQAKDYWVPMVALGALFFLVVPAILLLTITKIGNVEIRRYGPRIAAETAIAADEDTAAVTVRDHGVGLRPGEEKLVFSRFWRSDPSRVRRSGGTGLGLAISIEDARLHQGRLEAWGEPGKGACFRLTLPLVRGHKVTTSPLPLKPTSAERAMAGQAGDQR